MAQTPGVDKDTAAMASIKEELSLYQRAIDDHEIIILRINGDGKIAYCSSYFISLFGYELHNAEETTLIQTLFSTKEFPFQRVNDIIEEIADREHNQLSYVKEDIFRSVRSRIIR